MANVKLRWGSVSSTDITEIKVHRAQTSGFSPSAGTEVASLASDVKEYIDPIPEAELEETYYYIIEAVRAGTNLITEEMPVVIGADSTPVTETNPLNFRANYIDLNAGVLGVANNDGIYSFDSSTGEQIWSSLLGDVEGFYVTDDGDFSVVYEDASDENRRKIKLLDQYGKEVYSKSSAYTTNGDIIQQSSPSPNVLGVYDTASNSSSVGFSYIVSGTTNRFAGIVVHTANTRTTYDRANVAVLGSPNVADMSYDSSGNVYILYNDCQLFKLGSNMILQDSVDFGTPLGFNVPFCPVMYIEGNTMYALANDNYGGSTQNRAFITIDITTMAVTSSINFTDTQAYRQIYGIVNGDPVTISKGPNTADTEKVEAMNLDGTVKALLVEELSGFFGVVAGASNFQREIMAVDPVTGEFFIAPNDPIIRKYASDGTFLFEIPV